MSFDASVALFTRAWIEITILRQCFLMKYVALFTRAWIEIKSAIYVAITRRVALFTRAWIEITSSVPPLICFGSRPLYEGVD